MNRQMSKGLAGLALAILLLPAAAQNQSACNLVQCSAGGLSPEVLKEAVKETPASTIRKSAAKEPLRSQALPADAWRQNFPEAAGQEDYSCILSFGIGAQLAKQGFIGTRVFGRTQTVQSPDGGSGR